MLAASSPTLIGRESNLGALAGRHLFELGSGVGLVGGGGGSAGPGGGKQPLSGLVKEAAGKCANEGVEGMQFVKYMRHLCSHYLNTMCRNFATQ